MRRIAAQSPAAIFRHTPNCQAGDAPVLIRIGIKAGHGAGKRIEEWADMLAFIPQFAD